MSEIIWYLSFSHWFIALCIISSGPFMLSQKVKFSSLLQLSSIPLCKCPTVVLPTHVLMNTWATVFFFLFYKDISDIGVIFQYDFMVPKLITSAAILLPKKVTSGVQGL